MSRDVLILGWEKRRKVVERLWEVLAELKKAVLELDPNAEVYLFGSAAKGTMRPDSDVDVLVVSDLYGGDLKKIGELLVYVEEKVGGVGILEIHVATRELFETWYRRLIDVAIKL
ncbi:MAG: nucleotidyltransferase domain-containing protein [Thermoproteus sp.]